MRLMNGSHKFSNTDVITDNKKYGSSCPCSNLCIKNAILSDKLWKQESNTDTYKKFHNTAQHGEHRISKSLKCRTIDVEKIQNAKAGCHDRQIMPCNSKNLFRLRGITGNKHRK